MSTKARQAADIIRAGKPITPEHADSIGIAATYRALLTELGLMPRKGSDDHLRQVIARQQDEIDALRAELAALR